MVGIPVRKFGIPANAEPYLAAYEEVLAEAREEGHAEARDESGPETPKE
jgi:hypothetical protein